MTSTQSTPPTQSARTAPHDLRGRQLVADLRTAYARDDGDSRAAEVVDGPLARSEELAVLGAQRVGPSGAVGGQMT